MSRQILGLALRQEDKAVFHKVLMPTAGVNGISIITPFDAPLPTVTYHGNDVAEMITKKPMADVDGGAPPKDTQDFLFRAILLIRHTASLVYLIDEVSLVNLDLTACLVYARSIGVKTVGVMDRSARYPIDMCQLTYTDVIIGREDGHMLAVLYPTLEK